MLRFLCSRMRVSSSRCRCQVELHVASVLLNELIALAQCIRLTYIGGLIITGCWQVPSVTKNFWGIRVPLRALGSHTWTCTNLFALLIACVHRGAQLNEVAYEIGDFYRISSESTLWFYDIHMLSELLSDSERVSWSVIVINRGFSEFAISGLERSCLLFGMKVPEWVLSDLRKAPDQVSINSLDS